MQVARIPELQHAGATMKVTFETSLPGYFLRAVNGGGMGGANCGSHDLALHTNATQIGSWERFTITWLGPNQVTLQTVDGDYVTATKGGDVGGSGQPIVTNGKTGGRNEEFTLVPLPKYGANIYAIRTPNGINYVTAANGGGCGGNDPGNKYPIHTNATTIGPWQEFYVS